MDVKDFFIYCKIILTENEKDPTTDRHYFINRCRS